MGLDSPASQ